jgi:hypothetical protein
MGQHYGAPALALVAAQGHDRDTKIHRESTVAAIHCYTDNVESSTLDVKNNTGTGLLTSPITCNNTKTGGRSTGKLGGTTTIAMTV